MSIKREPTKSSFTKDGAIVRPMFPHEKDDYTIDYFSSLSKSYIGLPLTGLGTMGMAFLGKEFFSVLIDFCRSCYLTVDNATIVMIEKGIFIVFIAGTIMLVIGAKNLLQKITSKNEE